MYMDMDTNGNEEEEGNELFIFLGVKSILFSWNQRWSKKVKGSSKGLTILKLGVWRSILCGR